MGDKMKNKLSDYEESEKKAIASGKKALEKAPWLFNRKVEKTKGFFAELVKNDRVYPGYYGVHCVDGAGTRLYMSAWKGDFSKSFIDAGLMNSNDFAPLMHAYPDTLDVYLACQKGAEENHMGEIMNGLVEFAKMIRNPDYEDLALGKLETATLTEMISLGVPNIGVDFGVVLSGFIKKDKVPNLNPKPGHYIVGVSSSGMHSNGYTDARHTIFAPNDKLEYREEWRKHYKGKWNINDNPNGMFGDKNLLEVMSIPTANYLPDAHLISKHFNNPDIYGINITGNGLDNFNRVGKNVIFYITDPMPLHPIHEFLIEESGWDIKASYRKQNNGMGFAYIVPDINTAEGIVNLINKNSKNTAKIVGEVALNPNEILTTILTKPYSGGKPLEFSDYTN
jgi:phosphoribosylformylglycinamidine cyclo-ligase